MEATTEEAGTDRLRDGAQEARRRAAQEAASKSREVNRILRDCKIILEETLPALETAIYCTDGELPGSITIKVAFVPEKPGSDTKPGEAPKLVVSGKAALPSSKIEHEVSISGGQIALFD